MLLGEYQVSLLSKIYVLMFINFSLMMMLKWPLNYTTARLEQQGYTYVYISRTSDERAMLTFSNRLPEANVSLCCIKMYIP